MTDRTVSNKGLVVLICLMAVLGCGQRRAPVFPVSGSLLVNGRPAWGATVLFHPRSKKTTENRLPFAIVKEDGTFQPTMNLPNDGVPAGDYAVTVIWPTRNIVDGEEIEGPDQLQGLYAKADNPVASVTISPGPNEIPTIELRYP